MIDIKKLYALQKQSKTSFAEQRQLLKKVMAGKTVFCTDCKQPLFLFIPEQSRSSDNVKSGIRCNEGCTDIQLDFV